MGQIHRMFEEISAPVSDQVIPIMLGWDLYELKIIKAVDWFHSNESLQYLWLDLGC